VTVTPRSPRVLRRAPDRYNHWMTRLLRRARLVLAMLSAVGVVVALSAGTAGAGEVAPGIRVTGGNVAGPGLSHTVDLSEAEATAFVKGFLASGIFKPQVQQPPSDADVYTVHYLLATGSGGVPTAVTAKFAWNGDEGWVSGGDLYTRGQYIKSPPATTQAVQAVLDANGVKPTAPTSSDSNAWWWIVGGVLVLAVVVVVLLLVRRRRVAAAPS
jgi:hypothetical protein